MLKGVDVSGWNKLTDIDGADFVLVKATEGVGWKSDMLSQWVTKICGGPIPDPSKRYGFYHYARPETGNSAAAEANWFVSIIRPHLGYAALALDWEGDALKMGSSWALDFLNCVYTQCGYRPLLYISSSQENTGNYNNIRDKGYPLWVADWSNQPTLKHWPSYSIWQYTDKPVDGDYCLDELAWEKLAPNYRNSKTEKAWEILDQSERCITLQNEGLKFTLERVK